MEERQGRWNTVDIYLDSYIVSVFWLHLLCLYIVSFFSEKRSGKIKKGRLIAAAFAGALSDAGVLIWLSYGGERFLFGGAYGVVLFELIAGAWIAYGKRNVLRNSVLLFVVTALFAGVFQLIPIRNIGLFCLAGAVVLPFIIGGIASLFRAKQTEKSIYEARIFHNKEEKILSALMDTGNRLRVFGSRIPVVLVDETYLSEWIKAAEKITPEKLVFIPYKGVGGKGLLHGVRLGCELIPVEGKKISGEVAAVAAEHRLFHGCGYQMILQPEVLALDCVGSTQEGDSHVV